MSMTTTPHSNRFQLGHATVWERSKLAITRCLNVSED
jgi:hypothetical protein